MAVISITTTQNIELEYELASLGERIVATIIDLAILTGYSIIINLLLGFSGGIFNDAFSWTYILLFLPITFYNLLSEIFLNGQSVGKKVVGIKVISLKGNEALFGQYLIRWLFRFVDILMSFFVLATVMVAITEKHQRLGDLVAGTTLVKTKLRTALQQTMYIPVEELNYAVTYPEVINLTDRDMQLIKEVILNVQKTGNTILADQTMHKIETVLNLKTSNREPINFLYTVLRDYNYLASQ